MRNEKENARNHHGIGAALQGKKQFGMEVTESKAKVTELPHQSIFVFIRENSPANIDVGGKLLAYKE